MFIDKYQRACDSPRLLTHHISTAGTNEGQGLLKDSRITLTFICLKVPANLHYCTLNPSINCDHIMIVGLKKGSKGLNRYE